MKKTKLFTVLALGLASSLAGWAQIGLPQSPKTPRGRSKWVESTREEPPRMKYQTYQSRTIDGPVSYLIYLSPDPINDQQNAPRKMRSTS